MRAPNEVFHSTRGPPNISGTHFLVFGKQLLELCSVLALSNRLTDQISSPLLIRHIEERILYGGFVVTEPTRIVTYLCSRAKLAIFGIIHNLAKVGVAHIHVNVERRAGEHRCRC